MFFVQKRYGLNKKIFNVYKIRTMYENSKNQGNTIKNDSRIYSFALIIRKLRIDELPQIFNILLGDISLVGPRPLVDKTFNAYSEEVKSIIYSVKSGLTGIGSII